MNLHHNQIKQQTVWQCQIQSIFKKYKHTERKHSALNAVKCQDT